MRCSRKGEGGCLRSRGELLKAWAVNANSGVNGSRSADASRSNAFRRDLLADQDRSRASKVIVIRDFLRKETKWRASSTKVSNKSSARAPAIRESTHSVSTLRRKNTVLHSRAPKRRPLPVPFFNLASPTKFSGKNTNNQ
jgi:hypothetical protein